MISKKSLAATVLATSLVFSGVVAPYQTNPVSAATQVTSKYQVQLNTFASHYAKILRTLESYTVKLDKAKTEKEVLKIYDQYLTFFDAALDKAAPIKGAHSKIKEMDAYIYNSLVEVYNFELDTIDFHNGDITESQYKKAQAKMMKFVDAQDALFKKAAISYQNKFKVTFSKDMLYLLDEEAETPKTNNKTYKVVKGDTLYGIAKLNKTTVQAIKKINNLKSDIIRVGQVLKLPSSITNKSVSQSKYTVKKGDTLWSISKKANMTVSELKKINNLKSDLIRIGQTLELK